MGVYDILRFIVQHPIGGKHPLRNVADFARWQLASRVSPGPIIVDWIGGTRIAVERGMAGITGSLYVGLHEPSEMGFALHLLRPGDLLLDVGANVGSYTLLGGGVAGATVHAFEPVAHTFERLLRNVRLNDLEGRVTCHPLVVGAAPGKVRMQTHRDAMNRVMTDGESASSSTEVAMTTLDQHLPNVSPTLIKIDVEGFELSVLQGARDTLSRAAAVLIEVSQHRDEVLAALHTAGLTPVTYDAMTRTLVAHTEPRFTRGGNALFVRDVDWARERCRTAPRTLIKGVSV